jgi:hypothetical protein
MFKTHSEYKELLEGFTQYFKALEESNVFFLMHKLKTYSAYRHQFEILVNNIRTFLLSNRVGKITG